MAEELTLIGDDATIETCEFGPELVGDGTKTLDELGGGTKGDKSGKGYYVITARAASSSVFPDGLDVGDLFPADGDEVLTEGDKAKLTIASVLMDLVGWTLQFTADEIETTLLRHKVKKYRKGKSDASGSIKGVFVLGVTGESGGLLNQFVKIVKKQADAVTVSHVNSKPLFIRGVVRDTQSAGETYAFLWAQIELYGISLGADSGSRQEYESSMRLTGNDPVYYEEEIPEVS